MPSCTICLDELKSPVSLPCGHIYCSECLFRAINAVKPYTTLHFCPTCRTPYSIVSVDPSLVPAHLRPHIVPCVRRVFLEESTDSKSPAKSPGAAITECGRLTAENTSLRVNCSLWRKRAEVHAAATMGLLSLARMAKEQAEKMKRERDELQRQCQVLKRKLDAEEAFSSASRSNSSSPHPWDKNDASSSAASVSNSFQQEYMASSNLHCIQCAERWLGLSTCPHVAPPPPQSRPQSRPLPPQDGVLPPSLKRRKLEDPPQASLPRITRHTSRPL